MAKKYSPDTWDLDSMLDSTQYDTLRRCVSFVEDQIDAFDDRNQTEFAAEFGTLTQAAFLMITVAQLEHHLKKVCDVVAQMRNLTVRPTDLKGGNGFETCVAYLRKVLQISLPEPELAQVRAVVSIRNAWVHEGGYGESPASDLGPLQNYLGRAADGQIEFSTPFVQEACTLCQSLVRKIEETVQEQTAKWAKR
jgi:hypothetical protein